MERSSSQLDLPRDLSPVMMGEERELLAPEANRFSILDERSAEDTTAATKAQGTLAPVGKLAKFVDTVWNRGIAAIFSKSQRQLNAARDLIAKPTTDVTNAFNFITQVNANLKGTPFAPITFENFGDYIAAIKEGKLLDAETGEAVLPQDRVDSDIAELKMQFIQYKIDTLATRSGIALLQVKDVKQVFASTPGQVLEAAQKAVNAWREAVVTAGANLSDAEFRGLVTTANENLAATGVDTNYVQANTITDWAKTGQAKFVNEAAQEFADAISGIDAEDNDGQALMDLYTKIDTRAVKLGEILGMEDVDAIRDNLLAQLNDVPGFRENLETAQKALLQVKSDNQDIAFLASEQMELVAETQGSIMEAEKPIADSTLKGEAAVAATFATLLKPDVTRAALALLGREADQEEFTSVADTAVGGFRGLNGVLDTVVGQGNTDKVIEGQAKAEQALGKLDLLNRLVAEQNQEALTVDTRAENRPLLGFEQDQLPVGQVASALRNEFLDMIEKLAGNSDEEASPTMLAQVLGHLGDEGMAAVLGRAHDLHAMFTPKLADGEEITHDGRTMLQFRPAPAQEEEVLEAPRSAIDDLRENIRAVRAEIAAEAQRVEQERVRELAQAELLASLEDEGEEVEASPRGYLPFEERQVEPKPSLGRRFLNLFSRSKPQTASASAEPLDLDLGSRSSSPLLSVEPSTMVRSSSFSALPSVERGEVQERPLTPSPQRRGSTTVVTDALNLDLDAEEPL